MCWNYSGMKWVFFKRKYLFSVYGCQSVFPGVSVWKCGFKCVSLLWESFQSCFQGWFMIEEIHNKDSSVIHWNPHNGTCVTDSIIPHIWKMVNDRNSKIPGNTKIWQYGNMEISWQIPLIYYLLRVNFNTIGRTRTSQPQNKKYNNNN